MKPAWAGMVVCVLLIAPAGAIERRRATVGSFGTTSCAPDMFRGVIYDLPAETSSLPDLDKKKPTGRVVCTSLLNIPPRSFLEGIPGVSSRIEWFAIDYQGDFWVTQPGAYMFSLLSDDGSILYIDGKRIIDNDGIHAPLELGGRARLEVGKHHIRVAYFQGPRETVALVLKVAPPKGNFDFFDLRDYPPPATQKTAEAVEDESRPILRRATAAHDPMAAKAYELPALAALAADPRPRDFELRARSFRFQSQRILTLEVPGAALTATPIEGTTKVRIHVVLMAVIKDADGQVAAKISEDLPVELPAERLPALKTATVRLSRALPLPPGTFIISAVAADREGNRASTSAFRVNNADRSGVALSDLVLVRRVEPAPSPSSEDPFQIEDRRVVPELSSRLAANAQPSVYFVVYPNSSNGAKPELTVELSIDGKLAGRQTSPLPEPNAAGVNPMTISVPAKPGRNSLKITARQGIEAAERQLDYTIEEPR